MTTEVAPNTVHLRTWRADDFDKLVLAAVGISQDAFALRFGVPYTTIPDWYLARITEGWAQGTWNAYVAESRGLIVGWAEYGLNSDPREADVAALVCDRYQGNGLGTQILRGVASLAQAAAVRVLHAQIQVGNQAARKALHAALPNPRCTELQDGEWHYVVCLPRASNWTKTGLSVFTEPVIDPPVCTVPGDALTIRAAERRDLLGCSSDRAPAR